MVVMLQRETPGCRPRARQLLVLGRPSEERGGVGLFRAGQLLGLGVGLAGPSSPRRGVHAEPRAMWLLAPAWPSGPSPTGRGVSLGPGRSSRLFPAARAAPGDLPHPAPSFSDGEL